MFLIQVWNWKYIKFKCWEFYNTGFENHQEMSPLNFQANFWQIQNSYIFALAIFSYFIPLVMLQKETFWVIFLCHVYQFFFFLSWSVLISPLRCEITLVKLTEGFICFRHHKKREFPRVGNWKNKADEFPAAHLAFFKSLLLLLGIPPSINFHLVLDWSAYLDRFLR